MGGVMEGKREEGERGGARINSGGRRNQESKLEVL